MVHILPFAGSISGPHFPSLFFFFLQGEWDLKKNKKTENKSLGSNKWSTSASKNSRKFVGPLIDLIVDHLLTLLLLTPNLKKKQCPELAEKPISQCFQRNTATNTKKQKKTKNTIISIIANIIAPFDFDRKLFPLFVPPLFLVFPLPVAHLTTKQHKNKTKNKTTTKQQL